MADQDAHPVEPWWVQKLWAAAMTFGIPTLIIAFWLAQDAGWVANPVANKLEELKGQAIVHQLTMTEMAHDLKMQTEDMLRRKEERRKWCVKRATTDEERMACFPTTMH